MSLVDPIDPLESNPQLAKAFSREGIVKEKTAEEELPSYKMLGEEKIPVSKDYGKTWQSRLEQAKQVRRTPEINWSEAIKYYENDQAGHRNTGVEDISGINGPKRMSGKWRETENVVFANTTTMLPILYAKNPEVTATAFDTEGNADWATSVQALINAMFKKNGAPGVRLKPKARRGVLWVQLTNQAYMKVGWNKKEDSNEKIITELKAISEELANAKSAKDIKKAEGKLMALEEKTTILTAAGPYCKLVSPFRIYRDPTSEEPDGSDCKWMIEEDYLPTGLLNAVYGKDDGGSVTSLYEPTHILNANGGSSTNASEGMLEDEINNFTLFSNETEEQQNAKSYGYDNAIAYKKAQYTQVFWIWDKVTRRVFLFAANKWQWPVWVWDDPLKLIEFFPYKYLHFHESVRGSNPKGEVSYYLDQQDAINDNNSAIAQARDWAKNNLFYNSDKTDEQTVQAVLKGPDGTVRGIPLGDDGKMSDVIMAAVPPAMQHPELLSNDRCYAYINRVTGISEAQQGAQFKTNTTNDAVNFYQKNIDIRVDEKIDAIEDWIGEIGWALAQLAAVHLSKEDVTEIIGPAAAKGWRQVGDPSDLAKAMELQIVGGSTDKPTSKNKKRQALEIGQVMGQFASAMPPVAVTVLKVFSRAFRDEVVMTTADWDMIMQAVAGTGQGQQEQPNNAPGGNPDVTNPEVMKAHLNDLISKLPPEAQQQLQQMIKQGIPPQQALSSILEAAKGNANTPDQQAK